MTTKYDSITSFQEFTRMTKDIGEAFGRHGQWQEQLRSVNPVLAKKLENQLVRTNKLILEEEGLPEVEKACASAAKGLNLALIALDKAGAVKPVPTYLEAKGEDGIVFRVYADRGAIPDYDGEGSHPCVAASDLLALLPKGVQDIIRAFPGCSVSKVMDMQATKAKAMGVAGQDPLGLGVDPLEQEFMKEKANA